MDHIPLPLGAHSEDDEVPYLVKTEHRYDGQGFEGFLARKGFTICREYGESTTYVGRLQSDGDVSFDHAASLIQSWLYFGILQETAKALHFSISFDNFVKTKANGAKIINSQALTGVISQFALFELDQVEDQALFEARRAGLLILQANLAIAQPVFSDSEARETKLFTNHQLVHDQWQQGSKILLSICCLAELLHAVLKVNHVPAMVPCHSQLYLDQRMEKSGWCQNAIALKKELLTSPACIYFLSRLTPPYPDGHVGCTPQRCERSNIKSESYIRQHSDNCVRASCVDVIAEDTPGDEVRHCRISTLVDQGYTPVVNLDFGKEGPIIQVHPSTNVPRYVAISHVWSDGLGNSSRNAIYSCQLQRIQQYVNDLFGQDERPVPFWLDTVCVPKEKESRKRAILGMRDVYMQATKVLVLDKFLCSAPAGTTTYEKLMRISASVWATRLWTLNESILGKEMRYQFPDCATSFEELWTEAQNAVAAPNDTPTERTVKMLLDPLLVHGIYAVRRLSHFQDISALPEDKQLAHVQQALAQRSTSWSKDEAVCLTTLIGQSSKTRQAILNAEHDQRMRVLFQSMKSVPAGILFAKRPRYSDSGLRWIPKSLLWNANETSDPNFQKYGAAEVSPRGLIVKHPAIRFPQGFKEDPQQPEIFAFRMNDVVWLMAVASLHGTELAPLAPYAHVDFALITGDSLTRDVLSHVGALVTIEQSPETGDGKGNCRLYARWETAVAIAAMDIAISDYEFPLQEGFDTLGVDQEWCIG